MIIWINGAFGSGKSSVAEALHKILKKSFIYDPEQVGYFLWDSFPDEMKRKGDFQNIPIWREINFKILKYISYNYNGITIAPMTIYNRQYYNEIVGKLEEDKVDIKHFILTASKQTIINRLIGRGEKENSWAEQHIDVCIDSFDNDIPGIKINTENRSAAEIAYEIAALCGVD